MKPKLLLITANLLILLSISPQASYAADDPRVGKLLSQSGTALHVDALRSAEVIHVEGSVVASGISGSRDNWNEIGGKREASYLSGRPILPLSLRCR